MDATAADRQKRFRERQKRHKAGDHTLCAASKSCGSPAVTVTPEPVTAVTRNEEPFGPRGARLWREMNGDKLAGGPRVLLEEACRTADRLERFNALEAGELEALLRFKISDDGAAVTVTVDGVVSEARQQALALKQIIAELRNAATPAGRKRGTAAPAGGVGVPAGVVDLTARARERRAQAQG